MKIQTLILALFISFNISFAQGIFTWKTSFDIPSNIVWAPSGSPFGFHDLWKYDGTALGYEYYLMNVDNGLVNFHLSIGEGAYVRCFLPPGVSKIAITTKDASLITGCVKQSFVGEVGVSDVIAPQTDGSEIWTWGCGDFSRTWFRDANDIDNEGVLIIGYYNEDNLYGTGFNINQLSYTYYISDSTLYNTWLDGTLPIELINFNVNVKENNIQLNWETVSEINNDYFIIERSTDAKNWDELITVDGAGMSNQILTYNITDNKPINGISYYRLKQVDFDGQSTHSTIRKIDFIDDSEVFTIYPNPTTNKLNIDNKNYKTENIKILDITGKVSKSNILVRENTIDISDLQNGVYFIKVGTQVEKFIKE